MKWFQLGMYSAIPPLFFFFSVLYFVLQTSLNFFCLFALVALVWTLEDSNMLLLCRLAKDKQVADYQRLLTEESKKSETLNYFYGS